ncbi:tripartite tricarboxylate transporter TctB family protein [Jiella marina]|uniref:tripartite tricarboxylate transporter TctB family protein n=1 Tax=Jiella sp. LLJ827 TaxID=2917712 RepID=UPI0021006E9A|nr:tripartite tricarboxylate transporter TctB family protein [Jiella sp. LLJ827]MCQ0986046.1 tripartite tricarboxylate transporter TctB family protein [Jiella sp. LLJ827]
MPGMLKDRDLLSGLLFLAIGGAFALGALDLSIGTTRRMGPGYFPLMIGSLLVLIGVALIVKSVIHRRPVPLERLYFRPVAGLTLSICTFALLIERVGLVLTCIATVLVAGLASSETKWTENALIAVAMAVFAVLVFKLLLGLPFRTWW